MNMQVNLRSLAARDAAAAPFGFEQFEQRRAVAVASRRATIWSAAGSVAVLGLVSIVALVTQRPEPQLLTTTVQPIKAMAAREITAVPALVDLEQFDLTTELEDHIAALDDQLSAARVQSVSVARLRQLESTREQLNQSLQRVSYAHSLLNL